MSDRSRRHWWALPSIVMAFSAVPHAYTANAAELTYRHAHHLFTIAPGAQPLWRTTQELWSFNGAPIRPPAELRVDGDRIPPLPAGITRSLAYTWDQHAIAETIRRAIAETFNREPGTVTIARDEKGDIVFNGVGFLGREIVLDRAAELTVTALESGVSDIVLPVVETQPQIVVLDSTLQDLGIREVVAIGESDYTNSPAARRHNISTGLSKFNGHIVPRGETFSFNEILGPVNEETGYRKELVILGPLTLPAYGGGLCQISTTAYRGIWEYGFPIAARKNHSFAVRYYAPQGTDATIYPPDIDMAFINNSPGALLIQTHEEDDRAFFIYYGTRDDRLAEVIGPYSWDFRAPPSDRTEYTTEIPAGETRSVGNAVPGMQTAWFRVIRREEGAEEAVERFHSYYEARPNFTQIGQDADAPSWIGEEVP